MAHRMKSGEVRQFFSLAAPMKNFHQFGVQMTNTKGEATSGDFIRHILSDVMGNGISQILRSPRSPDEWDVTLISRLANFAPAVGLRPRGSECDFQDDSEFHFLLLASARKQLACDCLYFNAFEAGPAKTYGA